MTTDPFGSFAATPDDPYANALEIVPNDDADLPVIPRAILVSGTEGSAWPVRVTLQGGAVVTLFLQSGIPHPIRVTRIHATGTRVLTYTGTIYGMEDVSSTGLVILW